MMWVFISFHNAKVITQNLLGLTVVLFMIGSCNLNNKQIQPLVSQNPDSVSLDSINRLIRKNPENPDFFRQRAALQSKLKNQTEAINDATIAMKLDTTLCSSYLILADYYLNNGQTSGSKEVLEKAVKYFPDSIDAFIKLADFYYIVKQYNKAFDVLADARKIAPSDYRIYFLKGLIYRENKETAKAIENLQICVSFNPDYYEAYILLGLLYASKNDSLALPSYDNALRIKPYSYEAFYNKAMFYQDNHDPENALKMYEQITRQLGPNAYVYHNMGYVWLVFYSNYKKASAYFDSSLTLNPQYPEAYQNRAYCFEKLGRFEQATADYKKVLELVPNYELAVDGLNRIDKKLKKQSN